MEVTTNTWKKNARFQIAKLPTFTSLIMSRKRLTDLFDMWIHAPRKDLIRNINKARWYRLVQRFCQGLYLYTHYNHSCYTNNFNFSFWSPIKIHQLFIINLRKSCISVSNLNALIDFRCLQIWFSIYSASFRLSNNNTFCFIF